MSNIRTFQRSFSGGELTPQMFGKIDDSKFQSGLATCKNFITTPQGTAENRAGFKFVKEVKDSTKQVRLIPFTYSTSQTVVIEVGEGYFRFHTAGGTVMSGEDPYEVANPFLESDLFDLTYTQSNDVLTIAHPHYLTRELRRYASTHWELSTIDFNAPIEAPASISVVASGYTSAKYTYTYVVTALTEDMGESEKSDEKVVYANLYETGCTITLTWTPITGAKYYRVYKLQGGIFGYIGQTDKLTITDDNIAPDLSQTPPIYDSTFNFLNGITEVPVTLGGSGYGTAHTGGVILNVAVLNPGAGIPSDATLSVSDPTGSGAEIGFYWAPGGSITIVYVIHGGSGYSNPVITCSEWGTTEPIFLANASALVNTPTLTVTDATGSGAELVANVVDGAIDSVTVVSQGKNYSNPTVNIEFAAGGIGATFGACILTGLDAPGAIAYYEQRRCFAGSNSAPQSLWMTKSGTESNMSYSLPTKDDDRIAIKVAARESSIVRHIVPLSQLVLLTNSAEWRVMSVNSDAITPTSISVKPQSYIGSNHVQPCIVNNSLVFCAARGGHVREMGYNWQSNGFITGDLSLRSTHLFDFYELNDMCYQKSPIPILWFISTSGKLLGLTYIPEEQIGAWHQHVTDGTFESCTVVTEGAEDYLYVVVKRYVNGDYVRYVERMESRLFENQEDAFFVDSGLTYDGETTSTLSGLEHLEGCTVSVLADGNVQSQKVVTGGAITLDIEASVIQVGLPIQAQLKTLPAVMGIDGYGQGRSKSVNKLWLRTYRTGSVSMGFDEDHLVEYKQRTTENYGVPTALITDEIGPIIVPNAWTSSGQVVIQQDKPLPITVLSITAEVAIGG